MDPDQLADGDDRAGDHLARTAPERYAAPGTRPCPQCGAAAVDSFDEGGSWTVCPECGWRAGVFINTGAWTGPAARRDELMWGLALVGLLLFVAGVVLLAMGL